MNGPNTCEYCQNYYNKNEVIKVIQMCDLGGCDFKCCVSCAQVHLKNGGVYEVFDPSGIYCQGSNVFTCDSDGEGYEVDMGATEIYFSSVDIQRLFHRKDCSGPVECYI